MSTTNLDLEIQLNKISEELREDIKSLKSLWQDEAALEFAAKLSGLSMDIQALSRDISKF